MNSTSIPINTLNTLKPYTITYEEAGYILLYSSGPSKLKDLQEAIIQGLPIVKKHDCYRVLSDFRELKLTLSVIDIFSIPQLQSMLSKELGIPFSRFRRAVLVPVEDYDKYKFFEDVAVNRAHMVRVFVDKEQAIAWLLK